MRLKNGWFHLTGAELGGGGTFAPPEFGIFVPIFRKASQKHA